MPTCGEKESLWGVFSRFYARGSFFLFCVCACIYTKADSPKQNKEHVDERRGGGVDPQVRRQDPRCCCPQHHVRLCPLTQYTQLHTHILTSDTYIHSYMHTYVCNTYAFTDMRARTHTCIACIHAVPQHHVRLCPLTYIHAHLNARERLIPKPHTCAQVA